MLSKLLEIEEKHIIETEEESSSVVHGLDGLKHFRNTCKIGSSYYLKDKKGGYYSYSKQREVKFSENGTKKIEENYIFSKTDISSILGLVLQKIGVSKSTLRQEGDLASFIPVANVMFDPHSASGFSKASENDIFNMFTSTDYITISENIDPEERVTPLSQEEMKRIFPSTYHYFMNLCENNWQFTSLFINWLSTHLNTRKKLATSWIFKGGMGAGKDTLRINYLENLYGSNQVKAIDNHSVLNNFNSILKNALCVVLNESSLSAKESNKVSSILKNWISEEKLLLESKGKDSTNETTYFSFLAFSNNLVPVPIEIGDRRFNVMKTVKSMKEVAETDLNISLKDFRENLEEEAKAFSLYIAALKFDYVEARTVIDNKTKRNIQQSSQKRTKLFQVIISDRKPSDLRLLYSDIHELIIATANDKDNMNDQFSVDSEVSRLDTFMKYILSGKIPVGELSHFLVLYLSTGSEKLSPQAASRMLTGFFGETFKRKINNSDSNAARVKIVGDSLDPELIDIILSDEDIDSNVHVLKEEEIKVAKAFNISKVELVNHKKENLDNGGQSLKDFEKIVEVDLISKEIEGIEIVFDLEDIKERTIELKSTHENQFVQKSLSEYKEAFNLKDLKLVKSNLVFSSTKRDYEDFLSCISQIAVLKDAA